MATLSFPTNSAASALRPPNPELRREERVRHAMPMYTYGLGGKSRGWVGLVVVDPRQGQGQTQGKTRGRGKGKVKGRGKGKGEVQALGNRAGATGNGQRASGGPQKRASPMAHLLSSILICLPFGCERCAKERISVPVYQFCTLGYAVSAALIRPKEESRTEQNRTEQNSKGNVVQCNAIQYNTIRSNSSSSCGVCGPSLPGTAGYY